MRWLARIGLSVLLLAVAACGQPEPRSIEGHWVAENFRLQGIKLPIGPNLHITPHSMSLGAGIPAVPLVGIESQRDEVSLKTEMGVDLVFGFESKDRIFFELPLLGYRIYYQRTHAPVVVAVAPPTPSPAPPVVQVMPQEIPKSAPPSTPVSSVLAAPALRAIEESPDEAQYQAALVALRKGQDDVALRSLSSALQAGFVDWKRIDQEPLFERLDGDVRYEVIQKRWRK